MKRTITFLLLLGALGAWAAEPKADDIIGCYSLTHQGEESHIRVIKEADGTYTARVYWVKNRTDKDGRVRLDEKNPDKALRSTPCDRIVLFKGLKYDTKKKQWSGAKIYDPTRGVRANCTCTLESNGRLRVRGTVMGLGETVYWMPREETAK